MKAVVGAVAVACALILGGLAMAAGRSETLAGGKIQIFSDQPGGAVGKIVITGAIGDWGTATTIDKSGKVDANGNFVKIVLKKGGFEVDSTALNAKLNKAPGSFNKATCSFSFAGSGRVTLFNGTGLYKGLSGNANVTVSFGGIAPRLTSGAKKGQCNPNQNAKPLDQYGAVIGTGVVKFG
jgi:hypothetical protein